MSVALRPEREADFPAIRAVLLGAFPQPAEADLVEALRAEEAHVPDLCLVAERDGAIVGHLFTTVAALEEPEPRAGSPVAGGGVAVSAPLLVLGPMAVEPDLQRAGIGAALIGELLRRVPAAAPGVPLVSVLGHPGYYPRFGFEPARPLGVRPPFDVPDEAWMAFRLPAYPPPGEPQPTGVVRYADAFSAVT
ncbi:GNAT family N-acetyltransferase [Conexibacter arvalis]|uniref:Putative N-acetyltransferase YhbS n=1 Tax=Conexibacter arvalis TaxID=912552 RepID=A0A840IFZ6_9ACTN|nr:N-acetyltransferase [Conexibacter arvalis]MBB4663726.1 putative N-acetyltransferase YhbS [Conexibacter arvalis]